LNTDLSFFSLIIEASFLVQLVMLLLLVLSILSWTIVLQKWKLLKEVDQNTRSFENKFWSGGDISTLYKSLQASDKEKIGIEAVFVSGFSEYARLNRQKVDNGILISGTQRAMRVALAREMDRLDAHNDFLATVGSVSPYIGLFGTVWGIMNAFRGLANTQNATLAMVAPGISEALVATAMGLFAAIPSVVAYNRFSHDVDKVITHFENFADEFINILQHQSQ
jgi:biopolymer transport protein TolQ